MCIAEQKYFTELFEKHKCCEIMPKFDGHVWFLGIAVFPASSRWGG